MHMNFDPWNIFAIIGGGLFALAAAPAAWKTWKRGASIGTPVTIAWQISGGCISLYIYLLHKYGFDPLLALTYGVETFTWGVILWYHYFPRR